MNEKAAEFNCSYQHNAVCPYCGDESDVEAEDYGDDGESSERQCGKCEKNYLLTTNISVDFSTEKIPCA